MMSLKEPNESRGDSDAGSLFASAQIIDHFSMDGAVSTGEFRFPYYPAKHEIYLIQLNSADEPAAPAEKDSKTFGKYEVSDVFRQNRQYTTMYGFDQQLKRPVVIKAFGFKAFADFRDAGALRKQFYDEVRKLNRIHHPNIAVIYDAGEQQDTLYLVREYIEGKPLNTY